MKKIKLLIIVLTLVCKMSIAAVFVVTDFTDNATGNAPIHTLRWAIEQANATNTLDQILFQTSSLQTIQLQQNLPSIIYPVEIIGAQGNVSGADWNNLLVTIEGLSPGALGSNLVYCFNILGTNCLIKNLRFKGAEYQVWISGLNHKIVGCNFIAGNRGFVLDNAKSCKIKGCLFGSRLKEQFTNNDQMTAPNSAICFFFSAFPGVDSEQNEIGGLNQSDFNHFLNYGGDYTIATVQRPLSAIELVKGGMSPKILGNRLVLKQNQYSSSLMEKYFISCEINNNLGMNCDFESSGYNSYLNSCTPAGGYHRAVCTQGFFLEFPQSSSNSPILHTYIYLPTFNSTLINDFTYFDRLLSTNQCNSILLPNLTLPYNFFYYQSHVNNNFTNPKFDEIGINPSNQSTCTCPSLIVSNNSTNPDESGTVFTSSDNLYFGYNGTMSPTGLNVINSSTGEVIYNGTENNGTNLNPGYYELIFIVDGIPIGTYPVEIEENLSPEEFECATCIPSFSPIKGKRYILSVWVKETANAPKNIGYTGPVAKIIGHLNTGGTSLLAGTNTRVKVVDEWQLNEVEFTIPINAASIQVMFECNAANGDNCLFDDLRIIPLEAGAKSYVYDPISKKVRAELDQQHFATLYEYDGEGNLIRIKKETERGIMTIKESARSLRKK